MKNIFKFLLAGVIIMTSIGAYAQANTKTDIKGTEVTYTANGVSCKGYIAYDAAIKGKRPAILVVPEWWGCNDYTHKRADMLAALGYTAMAVDMYGDGKLAANPEEAQKLATPFYSDPALAKSRLESAEKKLKENVTTDGDKIGAIGYCFGGSMVLNAAKMGSDYKATVSFHGGLAGIDAAKGAVKGPILVCHGGADKFVSNEDVKKFRHNLDSVGVVYTFKVYANATHAFSDPDATERGKKFNMPIEYNEKADKESWTDMQAFLRKTFNQK
ncbi:MAG: dienelactone hydrolase [Bacteroidetes bacterium]|nr:dienelactone hydrolase [Bacteroidota bacterium]